MVAILGSFKTLTTVEAISRIPCSWMPAWTMQHEINDQATLEILIKQLNLLQNEMTSRQDSNLQPAE